MGAAGAVKRSPARGKRPRPAEEPAPVLPVARVCVDVPLPHLDRPFDYLVPAASAEAAQPGVRVRVRFAGQVVDGFVLERVERSTHEGRLAYLDRVVSAERVLTPEVARLCREVADRYAGTLSDVLRLAVPPRHARVESAPPSTPAAISVPIGAEAASSTAGASTFDRAAGASISAPVGGAVASSTAAESAPNGATAAAISPPEAAESAPDGATAAAISPPDGAAVASAGPGAGAAATEGSGAGAAASEGPGSDVAAVGGPEGASAGADAGGGTISRARPAVDYRGWRRYPAGAALLRAVTAGRMPRAVWTALPGEDWPGRLAEAAAASLAGGRGALIVVADARDLDRLNAALTTALGGSDSHVALSAAVGPAERYRRFLAASRGRARVVIGTRAAAFAPVADLGLVAIWDDGDDLHAEPRAPYPHVRQVLLARAELAGCGALLGAFARSAEAQQLVEAGWAREVVADRDTVRRFAPRVVPVGDDGQLAREPIAAAARLPSVAWRAARDALQQGSPVLIQVPRRGYLPAVACAECHTRSRCEACAGPLSLPSSSAPPACRWCGRPAAAYACPTCGSRRLRAAVIGARRTAEELARAFPDTPVRTSGRDGVLAHVSAEPALVVSTPGAEPIAQGGYGAVLLLDTWALLTRADLRATEEALRRWMAAACLASARGHVVVVADGSLAAVQALLRFDPGWLAARELAERRQLGFPPAARVAALTGAPAAVAELLAAAALPEGAELLGPVPAGDEQERVLVRTTRANGRALAAELRAAAGVRSAKKAPDPVRIQIDPLEVL